MPQLPRFYCSRCTQSVYNCVIDGVRVPFLAYLVVGQPPDTGPPVDLGDGSPVRVPSVVRALWDTDTPRIDLCMTCLAEFLGAPLVTAAEDPAWDANGDHIADAKQIPRDLPQVERAQRLSAHVFHAAALSRASAPTSPPALPAGPSPTSEEP